MPTTLFHSFGVLSSIRLHSEAGRPSRVSSITTTTFQQGKSTSRAGLFGAVWSTMVSEQEQMWLRAAVEQVCIVLCAYVRALQLEHWCDGCVL